ncbi:MAG TPA: hypothetical protein PKH65_09535 [Bacteroidia bacterium]|nr:hypothetical protein [Bacteroidia bacterium]HNT80909.1 hypothetical protein [Bacteroidia bacterium]
MAQKIKLGTIQKVRLELIIRYTIFSSGVLIYAFMLYLVLHTLYGTNTPVMAKEKATELLSKR